VAEANGSGSASGSHAYSSAGVYTLTLTVTDKDGGVGQSLFEFVVVFDPVAGFVTGGGWITSPREHTLPTRASRARRPSASCPSISTGRRRRVGTRSSTSRSET